MDEKLQKIAADAYVAEAKDIAGQLIEESYAEEMLKLGGYTQEEIDKLRTIYREARAVRKKQEKPIEPLEKFMEGGPRRIIDGPPVNPLGLGETHRFPSYPLDRQDADKLTPYKGLLAKELDIHKGKDRADIAAAVRYIRDTAFMNNPKTEN